MGTGVRDEARIFDSRLIAYLSSMHPEGKTLAYLSALTDAHNLRSRRVPGKILRQRVLHARKAYNQATRLYAIMGRVPILGGFFAMSLEIWTHEYFHLVYTYEVREKFTTTDEIVAEKLRVQLEYAGLRQPTQNSILQLA